jgi:ABC-type polysaccharide/polyol phosphate transport system ATPase subunit
VEIVEGAMNGRLAVSVESVSKSFRIATHPVNSLKERIVRLHRGGHVEFHALRQIDCEIVEGETVGILGHNGSGKSTLLKCIAGILTPTAGQVRVRGRLASLLELGAGFHPELSGRENVYINAAFYGMPRREIDRRFDDIVAFAELQQFIDEPVKHYSSGMYVRLGFAVAVNLEPDVLLVDEVLAVGDELFQAKCLSRIKQFQTEGRTIVFVTHDAATVRQVCDRAVVLDHGRLVLDGRPGDAIRTFREHLHGTLANVAEAAPDSEGAGVIGNVAIHHAHMTSRRHLLPGEPVDIVIDVDPDQPIAEPVLRVEVADRAGTRLFAVDSDALGQPLPPISAPRQLHIAIKGVWLLDGEYPVSLRLADRVTGRVLDWREAVATFEVVNEGRAEGTVALDVTIA